jgi:hypothetical protein
LDNIPTHRDRTESKNLQEGLQFNDNMIDPEIQEKKPRTNKKVKKKLRKEKAGALQETLFENHNRHETANFENQHGMPNYDENPVPSKRKKEKKSKKSRQNDIELQEPLFD